MVLPFPPELMDPGDPFSGLPPEMAGIDPALLEMPATGGYDPFADLEPELTGGMPPPMDAFGPMAAVDPILEQLMLAGQADLYPMAPKETDNYGYLPMPDQGMVSWWASHLKEKHRYRVERQARDLALYRQLTAGRPLGFDEERDMQFISAQISNLVNKMANMGAGADIYYEVPFVSEEDRTESQLAEDFHHEMRQRQGRAYARSGGGDLQRDEMLYAALSGVVVSRVLPDPYDDRFPFTVSLLDPATCYPQFAGDKRGLIRMVRVYQSTVADILDLFGSNDPILKTKLAERLEVEQDDPDFLGRTGEVVEYWDTWNRVTTFVGEVVQEEKHKLGYVPFVWSPVLGEPKNMSMPNGKYRSTTNGTTLEVQEGLEADMEHKGVSIFHHLVNTHAIQEAVMTLLYRKVEEMVDPATITYAAPQVAAEEPPPIEFRPRENNQRLLGLQQVQPAPIQPMSPAVPPVLQTLQGNFFGGSMNPAAMGMEMGANASGYALDTLVANAKDLAVPYMRALEHHLSYRHEMMARQYVDQIGDMVIVKVPTATNYGPSRNMREVPVVIFDKVGTDVRVKTKIIASHQLPQLVQVAGMAQQAGLMSQQYAMDLIGVRDPKRMFEEILAEKGMQHPAVMEAFVIPDAMERRGNIDLAEVFMDLVIKPRLMQQQMQEMQMQQMLMQPPGMGGPPPGMGGPGGPPPGGGEQE